MKYSTCVDDSHEEPLLPEITLKTHELEIEESADHFAHVQFLIKDCVMWENLHHNVAWCFIDVLTFYHSPGMQSCCQQISTILKCSFKQCRRLSENQHPHGICSVTFITTLNSVGVLHSNLLTGFFVS